jgi:hypothetical protein
MKRSNDSTGPADRASRRVRGSSVAEMVLALALLGVGAMGMDAVDIWKDHKQIDGHRYRQAVAIAEGQMAHVGGMHFEELLPTDGFEPVPWIHQPGFETGAIPVEIRDETGRLLESHVYRVTTRMENVDEAALVRKVELRVLWTETTGRQRSYTLSNVRFY